MCTGAPAGDGRRGVMMRIHALSAARQCLALLLFCASAVTGAQERSVAADAAAASTDAPAASAGVGVLALLTGAAMLLGALSGHREILQPLAGWRGATQQVEHRELAFEPIQSVADLDARLQGARGRPVLLDFWAEWCVSCKEMDQFTFSDARVQARLMDTLLLRADVTANNAEQRALLQRFKLFGPPGIVFFDRAGKEVDFRVIGFQSPEQFLASLDRAGMFQQPQ
jgi:thiol:disulfide interchange protein